MHCRESGPPPTTTICHTRAHLSNGSPSAACKTIPTLENCEAPSTPSTTRPSSFVFLRASNRCLTPHSLLCTAARHTLPVQQAFRPPIPHHHPPSTTAPTPTDHHCRLSLRRYVLPAPQPATNDFPFRITTSPTTFTAADTEFSIALISSQMEPHVHFGGLKLCGMTAITMLKQVFWCIPFRKFFWGGLLILHSDTQHT